MKVCYFFSLDLFKQHGTQHCKQMQIWELTMLLSKLCCCTRNQRTICKWDISTKRVTVKQSQYEEIMPCVFCPNAMMITKAPPRCCRLGPQQQPLLKTPGLPEESSSRETVWKDFKGPCILRVSARTEHMDLAKYFSNTLLKACNYKALWTVLGSN